MNEQELQERRRRLRERQATATRVVRRTLLVIALFSALYYFALLKLEARKSSTSTPNQAQSNVQESSEPPVIEEITVDEGSRRDAQ
ncbi:MAG: hypothetical protein Q4G03_01500 [Planctomycetia bacterium]|nr:hypothetical protein [Planctomycetia bacterium]